MAPGLLLGLIGTEYLAIGYHMVMGPKHSIMNQGYSIHCHNIRDAHFRVEMVQ